MDLIKEKEEQYKEYIDNHRANVKKAWDNMKNNHKCVAIISKQVTANSIRSLVEMIDNLVDKHDLTKYEAEEFDAYRRNFYPINDEEKESAKEDFTKAWVHHYSKNLHHWDWWYKTGNQENMPFTYCVEMVCDWIAMGYHYNNTATEWYEKEKDNIHLGIDQRQFVEKLMNTFYE